MYIVKKGAGYSLSDTADGAIVRINAPIVEENGKEYILAKKDDGTGYAGHAFSATEVAEDMGDGLFKITRTVKNEGYTPRVIKVVFESVTEYAPTKYLIPCVSYNGNKFGDGLEPKGMICEKTGEPWIHSFERTSIPSCSLTETKDVCVSLFADALDKDSMVSSVSLRPVGDRISQRIYWPVTEAPFTYYANDKYNEPLHTYITLGFGETFTSSVYMLAAVPMWENFGICQTLDRALELFPFTHGKSRTTDEIWRLGMAFSRYLQQEYKGELLFASGVRTNSAFGQNSIPHYEVGWCGQNIMNARMHMIEYFRTGERALLDNALRVCEAWLKKQYDNGLVLAHYEWYTEGLSSTVQPRDFSKPWASNVSYKDGWLPETCNTAWAACEMLKTWDLLRQNGIDRPDFKEFATKICDFFCDHYSEKYAFGKAWNIDGTCAEEGGTIGVFVTMALTEAYRILKDERYLEFAKKSLEFYVKRDLDNFVCTAGAIDCTCEDKETAGPVIIAALDLYEFTKEQKYLDYALKASYYFASWMYTYDGYYSPDKEFVQYGYYTSGSTAVSVQHPALDQWGELMCCEWLRLADYTGDERWRKRAVMMWYNATQCIADEENHVFHGIERPIGGQNEAFYQARWGHLKDCNKSGHLNDWCVSWVNVFRLTVLDRLTRINGYADHSALN